MVDLDEAETPRLRLLRLRTRLLIAEHRDLGRSDALEGGLRPTAAAAAAGQRRTEGRRLDGADRRLTVVRFGRSGGDDCRGVGGGVRRRNAERFLREERSVAEGDQYFRQLDLSATLTYAVYDDETVSGVRCLSTVAVEIGLFAAKRRFVVLQIYKAKNQLPTYNRKTKASKQIRVV